MANSQNGYPANNVNLTSSRLVPGTTRKLRVRNGPAGDLLLWVASQFDKLVEDIEQGVLDDWGYAERPIRGGVELSNHASGTAIDLNATAHPLSTQPAANFSAKEIAAIRAIVARTKGCVRWGGDYTGRKDGMHFEINASETACRNVLNQLNAGDDEMTPQDFDKIREMIRQEIDATQVVWWDGKKVSQNTAMAEFWIMARGIMGKAPFDGQPPNTPVVTVPTINGPAGLKANVDRIDEVQSDVVALKQVVGRIEAKLNTP